MIVLQALQLTKRYGSLTALDRADLQLRDGEIHGLIGPNGSGKSTLLKCIAGAVTPTSGTVLLGGRDVSREPPARRARLGLSLKFQITSVLPELSVYDNVLLSFQAADGFVALALSRTRDALDEAVMEMLQRFGLEDRWDQLAGTLPHGLQQWLEIALALARKPQVLLLDEPTAGMSPHERRATGALLRTLRQQQSLLIVEHDLEFVREICDSLTVLDQGRIVASGPAREVQDNPKVREVYLSHA
jgi:branched-chain amino acid transport system ATP-binding protein/urea transport system ATP-binding protein